MEIQYSDGSKNKIFFFRPEKPSKVTFLILPALGVRASYYKDFALQLQSAGFDVVAVDWRGQGESSVRPDRNHDFGYEQLIKDLHETILSIKKIPTDSALVLIGHSLGGQIGSLYAARYPEHTKGIVLITSGTIYYKGWKGLQIAKVIFAAKVFPLIARLFGYFPGKQIGFAGREAITVIKDWGNNVLHGKYFLTSSDFDYESKLKAVVLPVCAITIEGDQLVTKKSSENLYSKFNPASSVSHTHLDKNMVSGITLNHFNWAKNSTEIVILIENWYKTVFPNN